jgi:hypothetical protein
LSATRIGRVDCGFRRRQGEDQPAVTRIHGFEIEDITEERAVRLGVFTIDNYVSARNQLPSQEMAGTRSRLRVPWDL